MMPFEVSILNDPVAVSSSDGTITDINIAFTNSFGWRHEELVGQNAHLLIPSKFIRKSAHDKNLSGYRFGRDSRIIGKSRIVPVATPDDSEILSTIKIIPIKNKKEHFFMVLFNKIEFNDRFTDHSTDFKNLRAAVKENGKRETFKEDTIETRSIISDISTLYRKELEVIGDFIIENSLSPNVVAMCKHFLINSPIGNLGGLKSLLDRQYDSIIPYINVLCLRIIFPSIESQVTNELIDIIKHGLYDGSSEDCSM